MRRFLCLLPLCLAMSPLPANADVTGNQLYDLCTKGGEDGETVCTFYVMGAIDGLQGGAALSFLKLFNFTIWELPDGKYQTLKELKQSDLLDYCIPGGASTDRLRDVVTNYLAGHPETRHLNGATLTRRALVDVFDCGIPSIFE